MSVIALKNAAISEIDSKKDLIKRMFCKGSSDDELELFMHACKRSGLDPFMKQIYAIKRGASMTIQTGIDGFRLIAERTGNYSPGSESTFVHDEKGKLISATAHIKKRTSDGIWHDVSSTAFLDEYNANQGLWTKMPRAMLAKCAESLALRKAFPAELSGLYTSEEMDQASAAKEEIDQTSAPKEETCLSEAQCAKLDLLLQELKPEEINNLNKRLNVSSIYEAEPKRYDAIIRSIESKIKMKEALNGASDVA